MALYNDGTPRYLKNIYMLENEMFAVETGSINSDIWHQMTFLEFDLAVSYFDSIDAELCDINLSSFIDFLNMFRPSLSFNPVFMRGNRDLAENFCVTGMNGSINVRSSTLRGLLSQLVDRHDDTEVRFVKRIGLVFL